MRRTQEGYSPFKDDKPKDTENSPFEASSVLVVKANIKRIISQISYLHLKKIDLYSACTGGKQSRDFRNDILSWSG